MSSSSRNGLLAVCGSLIALSTLAVGLRFYVRQSKKLPWRLDDWLAVCAVATYIGAAICTFISVHQRFLGVPDAQYTKALALAIAESKENAVLIVCLNILVNTALACTKLSAVFFYRRVFVTGATNKDNWFNIATWVTIVIVLLWLLVFQFLTGFECGPSIAPLWNGTYAEHCGLSFPTLYGVAISDFLLDLWILVLPIPVILRIHATPTMKLSILGVFLLAFIGLGACIARMVLYIKVETGGPAYLFSHSEMRITTEQFYLNMLEAGMSCLAINLPSLWTLIVGFSPEKVLRSVRSLISLPLRGSQQQSGASNSTAEKDISTIPLHKRNRFGSVTDSRPSEVSSVGFTQASHIENQTYEAWATSDRHATTPPPQGKSIHVEHQVEIRRD